MITSKKISFAIICFCIYNISYAQLTVVPLPETKPPPIKRKYTEPKKEQEKVGAVIQPIVINEDYVAAFKSINEKMKDVLTKGNGFKDAQLTPMNNPKGIPGYYRNTNNNNGVIINSHKDITSYFLYSETRKKYFSLGAENSAIGYPTSDEKFLESKPTNKYGYYTLFDNGCFSSLTKNNIYVVSGVLFDKYANMGGPTSSLGFAISNMVNYVNGFNAQRFENGMVIANNYDAFYISGAIAQRYNLKDCGLPTADPVTEKNQSQIVHIITSQSFEKGAIITSNKKGTFFMPKAIYNKWLTYGSTGNANTCGLPTSEAAVSATMTAQNFEKGLMLLVNGKATFVPDDNPKNQHDNNKIRKTIKFPILKIQEN
jgi:hypothetical protein